ncbi:MAG: replication initiator protein A [Oscillospiraceae bacterium]|nr:replication initiator protein A [Oscillospiraceae bacterium]
MFESEYNEKGGFYMMPRQLFSETCPLSLEAKVLYTLIIDRTSLSLKNDFRDKKGKLFVYFTVEEAAKALGCGVVKAGNVITELVQHEYITKKRQGLGCTR